MKLLKDLKEIIDELVDEKKEKNNRYLRFTYYEVMVGKKLNSDQEDKFVELATIKLRNNGYTVYRKDEEFVYNNAHRKVEINELLIAIKND